MKEDKYKNYTKNGLVALRFDSWHTKSTGYKCHKYLFKCFCGSEFVTLVDYVRNGTKKSCGCLVRNNPNKHYMTNTPTYNTWENVIQRCTNPNNTNYKKYGGAGIVVCERWKSFTNFLQDMGERPEGTTLNRINGAKAYSKETCEWATMRRQSFDKRPNKRSKTGVSGVRRNREDTKWRSTISFNKKEIPLGTYTDFEEAVKARQAGELKYYGFVISKLEVKDECSINN